MPHRRLKEAALFRSLASCWQLCWKPEACWEAWSCMISYTENGHKVYVYINPHTYINVYSIYIYSAREGKMKLIKLNLHSEFTFIHFIPGADPLFHFNKNWTFILNCFVRSTFTCCNVIYCGAFRGNITVTYVMIRCTKPTVYEVNMLCLIHPSRPS